MRLRTLATAAVLVLSLPGCISLKAYPDPTYREATLASLGQFQTRQSVRLEVTFVRNGGPENVERAATHARTVLATALASTGAFLVVDDASAPVLRVEIDNIADIGAAAAKGFGAGLTFGLNGTAVADAYAVTFTWGEGDAATTSTYRHVLHSTVGREAPPVEGVAPVTPVDGFRIIIEDVVYNFAAAMKADGRISRAPLHPQHARQLAARVARATAARG